MDKDNITFLEATNDGQSIFIYYDSMVGFYIAYGYSAYFVTLLTEPIESYSDEMQMPVVMLSNKQFRDLQKKATLFETVTNKCYHLRIPQEAEDRYDNWANQLRMKSMLQD